MKSSKIVEIVVEIFFILLLLGTVQQVSKLRERVGTLEGIVTQLDQRSCK